MSEMSTKEHEAAVARVYDHALLAKQEGLPITKEQQIIYVVEHLMQEASGGASFDQYFRWADVKEITAVIAHLDLLGLEATAAVTREAIAVAFPKSVPATDDEKRDLTDDWSEVQEQTMSALRCASR